MSITRFDSREVLVVSASEKDKVLSSSETIKKGKYITVLFTDKIGCSSLLFTEEGCNFKSGDLITAYATNGELFLKSSYNESSALDRIKNTMKVFRNFDSEYEEALLQKSNNIERKDIVNLRTSYTEIYKTLRTISDEIIVTNEGFKELIGNVINKGNIDINKKCTDINIVKAEVDGRECKVPQRISQIQNHTKAISYDIRVLGNTLTEQGRNMNNGKQSTLDAFNQ